MSDARWLEIDGAIESAVRHFRSAVAIYERPRDGRQDLDLYVIEMGFMHAMQSGHASLENALLRILSLFGEEPPSGQNWDADLIGRIGKAVGNRPAVLTAELVKAANETRQFRHVAVRAYDNFDWDRASRAVGYATDLADHLLEALARFRQANDP